MRESRHPEQQVGRHCEGGTTEAIQDNKNNFARSVMDCFVTNVPRNDGVKKCAFTLAEVLITLGIIGVVATMTIPTLMSKIQKKAYYNQLLNSRATIEQGFRRMLAGEQTDDVGVALGLSGIEDETERAEKAKEKIMEYFKVAQFCINKSDDEEGYCGKHLRKHPIQQFDKMNGTTPITGSNAYKYIAQSDKLGYAYTLMDGTRFVIGIYPSDAHNAVGWDGKKNIAALVIDTNGDKAPNRNGHDIFRFTLKENANTTPYGTVINSGEGRNWKECNLNNQWCGCGSKKEGYDGAGEGCAGRVLEEGGIKY